MQRAEFDQWKASEVARLLALVEAERRYYQDIFAALPVAVAMVDPEWRLTSVNREFKRRLGLVHADFSRMRLPDLVPDPGLEAALGEVLSTGTPKTDYRARIGSGSSARRLRISIQKIAGWQTAAEDELILTIEDEPSPADAAPEVAQPEAAPRQSIEAAKRGAVERLSGRVAHVANNLLMIIGGYADEIINSLPENDPRRADLNEIVKASGRLGALTKDLTALTRPQAFEVVEFSLDRWLRAMEERYREFRVGIGTPERTLSAYTSPVLLEQMIFEAARYLKTHLGEKGVLRLEARLLREDRLELRLRVEGIVLGADAHERIFEPFSGEKVGTDPPLGLAGLIAPWLRLGGGIDMTADSLVIEMPTKAAAAQPAKLGTILLVEDEPGIRALIAKALERENYSVVQSGAPAEALAMSAGLPAPPALLVTDLMVPGMSGREFAERIRARWPATKVLFISGYTSDAELAAQIGSGTLPEGTRFLAKPFTVSQLLAEVKGLLA